MITAKVKKEMSQSSHQHTQKGLDVSRYDNAIPTQLKGVEDIRPCGKISLSTIFLLFCASYPYLYISFHMIFFSLLDIPALVEGLRKTFATDKTRSREWRLQQLHNFLRMLEEEGPALCDAMLQDLHKSPLEGYLTELGLVKAEVETAIENLDKWMTPTKTKNSALNIPCWSTTQRDPLGVVMIMGAWNYPMQVYSDKNATANLMTAFACPSCWCNCWRELCCYQARKLRCCFFPCFGSSNHQTFRPRLHPLDRGKSGNHPSIVE